jgi:hypothetical protein
MRGHSQIGERRMLIAVRADAQSSVMGGDDPRSQACNHPKEEHHRDQEHGQAKEQGPHRIHEFFSFSIQ